MIAILRRYRWLLMVLGLVLAAGALFGWWMLSPIPGGRFPRYHYDRIRLGMTPSEVELTMGSTPWIALWQVGGDPGRWSHLGRSDSPRAYDQDETWANEAYFFRVYYRDGKVTRKTIEGREPAWKIEARGWLNRLRNLVGL